MKVKLQAIDKISISMSVENYNKIYQHYKKTTVRISLLGEELSHKMIIGGCGIILFFN